MNMPFKTRLMFATLCMYLVAGSNIAGATGTTSSLPALQRLEDENGTRFIIPNEQLNNYVHGFGAEVFLGDDGHDHIRLRGWIPTACMSHISITLGNPSGTTHFDSERNAYPIHIEARSIMGTDGEAISPEQCFSEHRATNCNLSRNPSERTCTPIADTFKFESINLESSGRVVLRTESVVLDASTGLPAAPTDRELLRYTSQLDIAAAEEEEHMTAICSAASEGDRDAIAQMRQYAGLIELAERYESRANELAFRELQNMRVRNLDDAEDKAQALAEFAEDYPDYMDDVADELMALYEFVSDRIEAGDDDNEVRFGDRKLRVMSRLLNTAIDSGSTSARSELDNLAFARLNFAAQNPNYEASNFSSARRQAVLAARRLERRAFQEGRQGLADRPNTTAYLNGLRAIEAADRSVQGAWWQHYQRGEYNSAISSSLGTTHQRTNAPTSWWHWYMM